MSTEQLDQTAEWIRAYQEGTSASNLAKTYGVSVWSIITRLRQAGVEVRSARLQNERNLEAALTQEFTYEEIVDGLLLGDGSIAQKANLRLQQTDARFGWLLHVQEQLRLVGATSNLLSRPPKKSVLKAENRVGSGGSSHLLYTPAYQENHAAKARWYPGGGVKRVPTDLRLTPLVVAHWFSGDGSCGSRGTLCFYTNGFTAEDVDLLVAKLGSDLEVAASKVRGSLPGQYVVAVNRLEQAMKLKAIIEPWMPECCQYKFKFVRPPIRQGRFSGAQIQAIRRSTISPKELAQEYGVTQQAISKIQRLESYKWV